MPRPGSAADAADLIAAVIALCGRMANRMLSMPHETAPDSADLWKRAHEAAFYVCADAADLALWPLLPDDAERQALVEGIAIRAVREASAEHGRCWP